MKNVMLAGDVAPRSRTRSPSSRASHFINSVKPVERRCTRSPDTTPSSEPCWPEPPKILLNTLGATRPHCKGIATRVLIGRAFLAGNTTSAGSDYPGREARWVPETSGTLTKRPAKLLTTNQNFLGSSNEPCVDGVAGLLGATVGAGATAGGFGSR